MSTRTAIVLATVLLVGSITFALSWRSLEGDARPSSQDIFPKVQNPGGD
jgi:hypothetical protein